jgi:hypothetical protein
MSVKQVIVVGCHPANRCWLDNMLPSLEGVQYPLAFVVNEGHKAEREWLDRLASTNFITSGRRAEVYCVHRNAYTPGVLQTIVDRTDYEELCHLHDSCFIKDRSVFDLAFERKGVSVSFSQGFLMYIGKYVRPVLLRCGIPWVGSKRSDVRNEFDWNRRYIACAQPNYVELFPDWTDCDRFVEQFGQRRMMLENEYLIKWKGTWHTSMIPESA